MQCADMDPNIPSLLTAFLMLPLHAGQCFKNTAPIWSQIPCTLQPESKHGACTRGHNTPTHRRGRRNSKLGKPAKLPRGILSTSIGARGPPRPFVQRRELGRTGTSSARGRHPTCTERGSMHHGMPTGGFCMYWRAHNPARTIPARTHVVLMPHALMYMHYRMTRMASPMPKNRRPRGASTRVCT